MVELSLLRVFVAVARHGSVSRAAEYLNYVQPNVSARVSQLEQALGVRLFFRESRGMRLTPEGRALLPDARDLLERAQALTRRFADPNGFDGDLRLGTTDAFASVHLFGVAKALRAAFPLARIRFDTLESDRLVKRVAEHELDAAFVEVEPRDERVVATLVREDELMIATAPNQDAETVAAPDTVIVFPPGCSYRVALEQWYESRGHVPPLQIEFRGIDAVLGSVSAGVGITAVPEYVARASRFPIALHEFGTPAPVARTWWIRARDAVDTPLVRHLIRAAGIASAGDS